MEQKKPAHGKGARRIARIKSGKEGRKNEFTKKGTIIRERAGGFPNAGNSKQHWLQTHRKWDNPGCSIIPAKNNYIGGSIGKNSK